MTARNVFTELYLFSLPPFGLNKLWFHTENCLQSKEILVVLLRRARHNTTDRSRKCLLKVIQNPFSRTLHNDAQRTPSGWRERQVSIFSNVRRAAPEESHSNPSNLSILLRSINYVLRKINYNFSLLHFYCTFGLPLNSIITEGEKRLWLTRSLSRNIKKIFIFFYHKVSIPLKNPPLLSHKKMCEESNFELCKEFHNLTYEASSDVCSTQN